MLRAASAVLVLLSLAPATADARTPQQEGWAALARRHEAYVRRVPNRGSYTSPSYYDEWPLARASVLRMCAGQGGLRPSPAACRAARASAGVAR